MRTVSSLSASKAAHLALINAINAKNSNLMWGCSHKLVNTSNSQAVSRTDRTPPRWDGSTNYGTTFECAFNNWHLARYFESKKMEISWINKQVLNTTKRLYTDKRVENDQKMGGIYNNHNRRL